MPTPSALPALKAHGPIQLTSSLLRRDGHIHLTIFLEATFAFVAGDLMMCVAPGPQNTESAPPSARAHTSRQRADVVFAGHVYDFTGGPSDANPPARIVEYRLRIVRDRHPTLDKRGQITLGPRESRVPVCQLGTVSGLTGDEWVLLENLTPGRPVLATRLPFLRGSVMAVDPSGRELDVPMTADTLYIHGDTGKCTVLWRGHLMVGDLESLTGMEILGGLEPVEGGVTSSGVRTAPQLDPIERERRERASTVILEQAVTGGHRPIGHPFTPNLLKTDPMPDRRTLELEGDEASRRKPSPLPFSTPPQGVSPVVYPRHPVPGAPWSDTPAMAAFAMSEEASSTVDLPPAVAAPSLSRPPLDVRATVPAGAVPPSDPVSGRYREIVARPPSRPGSSPETGGRTSSDRPARAIPKPQLDWREELPPERETSSHPPPISGTQATPGRRAPTAKEPSASAPRPAFGTRASSSSKSALYGKFGKGR